MLWCCGGPSDEGLWGRCRAGAGGDRRIGEVGGLAECYVRGAGGRFVRRGRSPPTPPPGDGVPGTPQSRWAARPSCASVAGGRGNASRWGLETVQGVLDEPLPVPLGARCWDGNRGAPTTSRDRPRAEGPARPLGGCFAPSAAVDARCCGGLSDEGSGVAGGTGLHVRGRDHLLAEQGTSSASVRARVPRRDPMARLLGVGCSNSGRSVRRDGRVFARPVSAIPDRHQLETA